MCKNLSFVFLLSLILFSLPSPYFAQSDSVITIIRLPDNLGESVNRVPLLTIQLTIKSMFEEVKELWS
jgi:hypothetical protein